jgi:hypothetical protein
MQFAGAVLQSWHAPSSSGHSGDLSVGHVVYLELEPPVQFFARSCQCGSPSCSVQAQASGLGT